MNQGVYFNKEKMTMAEELVAKMVKLEDIDGGNALALFNKLINEMIADVDNPNKKAVAARSATLTVKMVPATDRRSVQTTYEGAMKGGKMLPRDSTTVYLGRNFEGNLEAAVYLPNQIALPTMEAEKRDIDAESGAVQPSEIDVH
jgi:hypothetical protein